MTEYVPYNFVTNTVVPNTDSRADLSAPFEVLKGFEYEPDSGADKIHMSAARTGTFSGVATGFTGTAGTNEITYATSGTEGGTPSNVVDGAFYTMAPPSSLLTPSDKVTFTTELFPEPITVPNPLTGAAYGITAVALDNSGYSYCTSNLSGVVTISEIDPEGSSTSISLLGLTLTKEVMQIVPVARTRILLFSTDDAGGMTLHEAVRGDPTVNNLIVTLVTPHVPFPTSTAVMKPQQIVPFKNTHVIFAARSTTDNDLQVTCYEINFARWRSFLVGADLNDTIVGLCVSNDRVYVSMNMDDGATYRVYDFIPQVDGDQITGLNDIFTTMPDGATVNTSWYNLCVEPDNSTVYAMVRSGTTNQILSKSRMGTTWSVYGSLESSSEYAQLTRVNDDFFSCFKVDTNFLINILNVNDSVIQEYVPSGQTEQLAANVTKCAMSRGGTSSFISWNATDGSVLIYVLPVSDVFDVIHQGSAIIGTPGSSDDLVWIILGSVLGAIALAVIIYFAVKAANK